MNRTNMIYNRVIQTKILEGMKFANYYKYQDLMSAVVDAVFSYDEDNHRLTLNTINNFKSHYKPNRKFTVRDFILRLETEKEIDFAEDVLKSKLKTATKGGIIRADAVIKWAYLLNSFNVQKKQDLYLIYNNPEIILKLKAINGQKDEIIIRDFLRIAGSDDLIKPTRYMVDFVNDSIDEMLNESQTLSELKQVLIKLRDFHPKLTLRDLDYAIWYYMQTPEKNKMPNEIRNMNRPPKKGKIVPNRESISKSRL